MVDRENLGNTDNFDSNNQTQPISNLYSPQALPPFAMSHALVYGNSEYDLIF